MIKIEHKENNIDLIDTCEYLKIENDNDDLIYICEVYLIENDNVMDD
jgi:hypothetical protein